MQLFYRNIKTIKGILVATLLLILVEFAFHQDEIVQKYRSVFAAGRLMDKIDYINNYKPKLIVAGNSRIDNGIDPMTAKNLISSDSVDIFNLGIPGSNMRVIQGVTNYITANNNPLNSVSDHILIGLDPGLFILEEQLGYSIFFGDRKEMWNQQDFHWLLASIFRLWGFSPNLKGLREPDKLQKFIKASFSQVEAWGGDVTTNKGFRAEEGILSVKEQHNTEDFKNTMVLDNRAINYFMKIINDLKNQDIEVAIFYPLVYKNGKVIPVSELFEPDDLQLITDFLKKKNIRFISDIETDDFTFNDFFNPGHFNSKGAEKFTRKLITRLMNEWPSFVEIL